jgi:hypothetical protein
MKSIKLIALALTTVFAFSSCSNEETNLMNNPNEGALKTYKIKRDATGAYSLDINLSENTKVDNVLDATDNTSKYYLSSTNESSKKSMSDDLLINDDNLKVSFIDTEINKGQSISIKDDNISFLKKNNNSTKLKSYSIESNEDGTYALDFSVKNNTDVSFVYNESIKTYEVHLENGSGSEKSFSRTLEKEEGLALKLDFVNHLNNSSAKSEDLATIRKPIIIIDY